MIKTAIEKNYKLDLRYHICSKSDCSWQEFLVSDYIINKCRIDANKVTILKLLLEDLHVEVDAYLYEKLANKCMELFNNMIIAIPDNNITLILGPADGRGKHLFQSERQEIIRVISTQCSIETIVLLLEKVRTHKGYDEFLCDVMKNVDTIEKKNALSEIKRNGIVIREKNISNNYEFDSIVDKYQ